MTATLSKQAKTSKQAKSQAGYATAAVHQYAEMIAGAYDLLATLDDRMEELQPAELRLSVAEEGFLQRALPWVENRHHIVSELTRVRGARLLRQEGVGAAAVGEAAELLYEAEANLRESRAKSEQFENATSSLLVDQVANLNLEIDRLKAAVDLAQRNLDEQERLYDKLLNLAPKPLLEATSGHQTRRNHKVLERRSHELQQAITNRSRIAAMLAEFDQDGAKAFLHGSIVSACPDALVPYGAERQYDTISAAVCHAKATELRASIPALEQELADVQVAIADERQKLNQPLEGWAATGVLTPEMLTASNLRS